jgi:hypothetical protein
MAYRPADESEDDCTSTYSGTPSILPARRS